MKICMVFPGPYPANRGTPARIHEMSELLAEKGHEVHIVCYHHGTEKKVSASVHRIPETHFYRKGIGPSWDRILLDAMLFFKVLKLCATRRIDILHCFLHEGAIIGLPIAKTLRKPIIFDVQSSLPEELLATGFIKTKGSIWKFLSFIDRNLPRCVDYNIVVGKNLEQQYRNLGIRNMKIVPTCTDMTFFKPFPSNLKKQCKMDDKMIVGYQGNLSKLQNVEFIVKIADRILANDKSVKFLIGYTSDPTDIEELVAERGLSGSFIFMESGYEQTPDIINACDIMLIPRMESFGVPVKLLNFLACGKPVVMFKSVSKGAIDATDDQEAIYEADDEQQFQRAVLDLIESEELRRRYGENARRYAVKEFSREKLYNNVYYVYNRLLNR